LSLGPGRRGRGCYVLVVMSRNQKPQQHRSTGPQERARIWRTYVCRILTGGGGTGRRGGAPGVSGSWRQIPHSQIRSRSPAMYVCESTNRALVRFVVGLFVVARLLRLWAVLARPYVPLLYKIRPKPGQRLLPAPVLCAV